MCVGLCVCYIQKGKRQPCSSKANPTMWKAVEIILGIALVTPENITDQFGEAVLTRTQRLSCVLYKSYVKVMLGPGFG